RGVRPSAGVNAALHDLSRLHPGSRSGFRIHGSRSSLRPARPVACSTCPTCSTDPPDLHDLADYLTYQLGERADAEAVGFGIQISDVEEDGRDARIPRADDVDVIEIADVNGLGGGRTGAREGDLEISRIGL